MLGHAVWMGPGFVLVHKVFSACRPHLAVLGIFSAGVYRRCSGRPLSSPSIVATRLPPGIAADRCVVAKTRDYEASGKRLLGIWCSTLAASWIHIRHYGHDVFCTTAETIQCSSPSIVIASRGTLQTPMGDNAQFVKIPRYNDVTATGGATCTILRPCPVCVAKRSMETRWREIKGAVGTTGSSEPAVVDKTGLLRQANAPTSVINHSPFRRFRCWLGRCVVCAWRSASGNSRGHGVSRSLVPSGIRKDNTMERAEGSVHHGRESGGSRRPAGTVSMRSNHSTVLSRQLSLPVYSSKYVHSQRRMYATIMPPPTPPLSPANRARREVATICCQRPCGPPFKDVGSQGSPDETRGLTASECYLRAHPWASCLPISPSSGTPYLSTKDCHGSVQSALGRRPGSPFQPTSRLDFADPSQDIQRQSQRDTGDPGLAKPDVVPGCEGNGNQLECAPALRKKFTGRGAVTSEQLASDNRDSRDTEAFLALCHLEFLEYPALYSKPELRNT